MFNNPGAKIKGLAKVFFWIEVVAFVLVFLAMGDYLFEEVALLIGGLVGLAAGVGVAYISALFLAAFGELVETNTQLKLSNDELVLKANTPVEVPQTYVPRPQKSVCPICGNPVTPEQAFCPSCGNKI